MQNFSFWESGTKTQNIEMWFELLDFFLPFSQSTSFSSLPNCFGQCLKESIFFMGGVPLELSENR